MDFIYDSAKSKSNLQKHGIDFEAAKGAWVDKEAVTVKAKTVDEDRFAIIAKIAGKIWIVFFTYRENKIRIISARRAQPKEARIYG